MKKLIKKILKKLGYEVRGYNITYSGELQLKRLIEIENIDLVLDVGANEGQFAKNIRENGYRGKIISFEPLSSAYKKLKKHAEKDTDWVVHERCAVGESSEVMRINISENSVSSSLLPMLEAHSSAAKKSIYIDSEFTEVRPLDSLMEKYDVEGRKILIKIDTQGYEWCVLKGAPELLKKTSVILCELSLVELYQGQKLWRDVVGFLYDIGFTCWSIKSGFTNQVTGQCLQMDMIFIRNVFNEQKL